MSLAGLGTLWLKREIFTANSLEVRMIELHVKEANVYGLSLGTNTRRGGGARFRALSTAHIPDDARTGCSASTPSADELSIATRAFSRSMRSSASVRRASSTARSASRTSPSPAS